MTDIKEEEPGFWLTVFTVASLICIIGVASIFIIMTIEGFIKDDNTTDFELTPYPSENLSVYYSFEDDVIVPTQIERSEDNDSEPEVEQ